MLREASDAEINDEAAVNLHTHFTSGKTIVNTTAKSRLLYTGDCENLLRKVVFLRTS